MNKLILAMLIFSSNCVLSDQDKTQTPVENRDPIKITPLYDPNTINQTNNTQENTPNQSKTKPLVLPAEWILESSMENAPELLKGIFLYLQSRSHCIDESQQFITIPSYHRFILVGPPGSGKTTLAYAIAHILNYPTVFIPATGLFGRFRNETANNIQNFLMQHSSDGLKKVIIIDELHKLFEHHGNDHSDDSQSAAAFWLALDNIEKQNPNVIFIGTANNVDKLPPEIKSRFSGKIITMSAPDKNQKIQAFKNNIAHDTSVILDKSVNDFFIANMIQQIQTGSLRDVQLIIDTAKMFSYAEGSTIDPYIILTKAHFQQALDQLQTESKVLQESFTNKLRKQLELWGIVFGIAANACVLTRASFELLYNSPQILKKIQSLCHTTANIRNNTTQGIL